MSEEYSIEVYDLTFFKVDDEGDPLRNEDGTVKRFYIPNYDASHLAEGINEDDLVEEKGL
jgi:hypothetical protein|tara:strand:+ start:188 stop:367 length:180 start_codon:yes stop_codon:yes gene_type:complete